MPQIPDSVEIPVNRRSVLAALATGFFVYQGGEKIAQDIGTTLDSTPDELQENENELRDDLAGLHYPSGIDGSDADIDYTTTPSTDKYTYTLTIGVDADIDICQYSSADQLIDDRDYLDTAAHKALDIYRPGDSEGDSWERFQDMLDDHSRELDC
jgi:hypothetical protein